MEEGAGDGDRIISSMLNPLSFVQMHAPMGLLGSEESGAEKACVLGVRSSVRREVRERAASEVRGQMEGQIRDGRGVRELGGFGGETNRSGGGGGDGDAAAR